MSKTFIFCLLIASILHVSFAPPVTPDKNKEKDKELEENEIGGLEDYMEYHRYLREVVNALESDADFRTKLEKAEENDIRTGKIAEELQFVAHHVRTRLDEIKRVELERLKKLTEKKRQLEQQTNTHETYGHLDHANPHTFEIEDLIKLIAKTTQDLAEADKKRRVEFKEYELQKEYEKQKKLNETNEEERVRLEKEFKEKEQKHQQHEKLHEPGHKAQLEEVWEEQDQMQQEFDPKMFFMLHDLDGNGLWDQDEVKALFVKELDKMYNAGTPEDDMRERAEEMERMRESVFKEVDVNRDGFIDYDEFLAQTRRNDFQQDHGWQGLDEQRPYTDEELAEYIRQHEMERIRQGYPPSQYPGQVPPAVYQQVHPGQGPQGQYQGNIPPHPGVQYNAPPVQYHPQSNQAGIHPPNQQYQQMNQQYQQYQQPNQQFQQQNQQPQQTNQQFQQPNQQFQQANQQQQPNQQQQQLNQQRQQQPNQQQQHQPNQQQHQQPNQQQHQQPNQQQHQQQNQHQFQQPNIQYQQPQPPQDQSNQQQAAPAQLHDQNSQQNKPDTEQKAADSRQDPHVNMI